MNLIVRMLIKSTDIVASFAKGLRVIECFGADRPRLSISDVASATGLDRAAARRSLLTLHAEDYADYDGKYFTLTPRILRLGVSALASLPLPQIVQPWLDQLTEQIGQSCSVSILDGTEFVYLARAAQKKVMSIGLMPGSRLPAHCTSMGRVLLAALPGDEARRIVDTSDLTPRTPYSLTDPLEIMICIERARDNGFALIDQEVEVGLRSIAVPLLYGSGKTVAALNAGLAVTQETMDEVAERYFPSLQRVQTGLRRVLN
jgi:IclR family pca regulon transcriptional regulator